MASASYNDSIFIMGGKGSPRQVTEYRICDDIMVDHGEYAVSESLFSNAGPFLYQWNNSLYANSYGVIVIYDMEETEFWKHPMPYIAFPSNLDPSPPDSGSFSCVTGTNEYLIMSGGWSPERTFDQVWVLLLNEDTWVFGPSMAVTRTGHGCCFVSDFVYVIGGNGGHRSIEKIHIDHVTSPSQAWTTLKNELIVPSYMGSYVSYMSSIWIITGGYEEPNNMYVQVI
eukprot:486275_1